MADSIFTVENFIKGLQKMLVHHYYQVSVEEDAVVLNATEFQISFLSNAEGENQCNENTSGVEEKARIHLTEIQQEIDDLCTTNSIFEDCILHEEKRFEVCVEPQGRESARRLGRVGSDALSVSEHNYSLKVSSPSRHYLVALLCSLGNNNSEESISRLYFRGSISDKINNLNDLGRLCRFVTIQIEAPCECAPDDYKIMLSSYLFNISYNENIALTEIDIFGKKQPINCYVHREGQLFPYRQYNQELLAYYNQGITAAMPFTQYLAFYHIAEFFFQTIAEENAFNAIENIITRPSFSPHKKEDVRSFYTSLKNIMRNQREDGVWEEKKGLLLCLKRYVGDIDSLKSTILSLDKEAIDYYKSIDVPFASDGKTINFDDGTDAIYTLICNRIYAVRNAIVHSKEGEKLRYEPFRHDRDLAKEIPLMRAVAEEILINSAKPMGIKYPE